MSNETFKCGHCGTEILIIPGADFCLNAESREEICMDCAESLGAFDNREVETDPTVRKEKADDKRPS